MPYISTHTLTWSVTFRTTAPMCRYTISTHTLTWSVTLCRVLQGKEYKISTHTLTWSVTQVIDSKIENATISTHTLTWSVTPCYRCCDRSVFNFNSHAHVERDLALPYYPPQDRISTHTLTWSVTGITGYKQAEATFQLTRSRGA